MKKKSILLLIIMMIFSCSVDEAIEDDTLINAKTEADFNTIIETSPSKETDVEIGPEKQLTKDIFNHGGLFNDNTTTSIGSATLGGFGDPDQGCGDFVAPFVFDPSFHIGYIVYNVYYDSTVISIDEINCIRKEYFEEFSCLRIEEGYLNPNTPYHDVWYFICDPTSGQGGSGPPRPENKASTDPRVQL